MEESGKEWKRAEEQQTDQLTGLIRVRRPHSALAGVRDASWNSLLQLLAASGNSLAETGNYEQLGTGNWRLVTS